MPRIETPFTVYDEMTEMTRADWLRLERHFYQRDLESSTLHDAKRAQTERYLQEVEVELAQVKGYTPVARCAHLRLEVGKET